MDGDALRAPLSGVGFAGSAFMTGAPASGIGFPVPRSTSTSVFSGDGDAVGTAVAFTKGLIEL